MFDELGDGIFRRQYEFLALNIGVVVGDEAVLVIDTRESHVAARILRDDIRTLTSKPILWVVNTHWHWDHSFGNGAFPDADIWGHRRCARRLTEDGDLGRNDARRWMPEDRWGEIDEVDVVAPAHTFEAMAEIDVGPQTVHLGYHGRGHTDNDIVVHVGNVSFLGDLVEDGGPPYMGDGYLLEWPFTLEIVEGLAGDVIVPGHGGVRDHRWLEAQRPVMAHVADLVTQVVRDGRPVSDAAAEGPFDQSAMIEALERGAVAAME